MSPRIETELLNQTIEVCECYGWHVHHDRPARTEKGWRTAIQGHAGFPDLVLAKGGWMITRELKGRRERLSDAQWVWARKLSGDPDWIEQPDADPVERAVWLFDVWRPKDFSTLIVPLLSGKLRIPTCV